ncbi:farnesol dehydrogenase-like isoform X2 [Leptopilina heterotoma]|uniref:farnesol dehydrogenase-like isoform X2 n=1 Tax=Leptopilina heterotoma TaxID=63436 RepID=UPI001CA87A87|nr:farnesol dehydrogenase-like isoform X2 [Leptopilina heterotoma]
MSNKMDRWNNKVAVVTGASSGIGEDLVKTLVKKNVNVIGLARRIEKMEKIKNDIKNEKGSFHPIKCDISREEDIINAFQWIKKNFKTVDILVNNAGAVDFGLTIESSTEILKNIIDVNLLGPTLCTREAAKLMRANNTAGHIINIDSVLGQQVLVFGASVMNLYSPTKFALHALSKVVELELECVKSPAKVTTIFPGLVKTEMPSEVALKTIPYVYVEDISEAIIYVLSTPPHVQIKELTISSVPGYQRK